MQRILGNNNIIILNRSSCSQLISCYVSRSPFAENCSAVRFTSSVYAKTGKERGTRQGQTLTSPHLRYHARVAVDEAPNDVNFISQFHLIVNHHQAKTQLNRLTSNPNPLPGPKGSPSSIITLHRTPTAGTPRSKTSSPRTQSRLV